MTRIERLLGAPAGDEVERTVDLIITDDWTTPALEAPLAALGTTRAAAPIVLVRDHTQSLETYEGEDRERVARLRAVEDEFVQRFGAERIVGRGIQHHVLPACGRLRPGMLLLGNDSHAPTLGAYGVAAFAAQPMTIAAAIHTGRLVMRVPETLQIRLVGRLGPGVSARDAALTLLDRLRDGGAVPRLATGKALEFSGPGVATLSMAERAVLANATPEAVAATAIFPVDDVTLRSLGIDSAAARVAAKREAVGSEAAKREALGSDVDRTVHRELCDGVFSEGEGERDAETDGESQQLVLDLGAVVPAVARSGQPADVVPLDDFPATRVDRVFVGTCAGGTYEEIRAFAEALGERTAIPALVAPASSEVEARLREEGTLERLTAAGVTLLPPGCGPCFGFGVGRLADGEIAVVTGNRNSVGRMGSPHASIHLAGGRTAGEAARTGRLGRATGQGDADEARSSSPGDFETARREAQARSSGKPPEAPTVVWPRRGNVVRLRGTVSTDDLTPSAVPGVGASSDRDPLVLRRLLLHYLDPTAATRDLSGTVVVADENFGVGSNRASSVRALRDAGVRAVIARSVAPLYAMGARDEGFLVVTLDDDNFYELANPDATVEVDPGSGLVRLGEHTFPVAPASDYERAVRAAGGVVAYLSSGHDIHSAEAVTLGNIL
ncbi:MAG: aconitase family protein [Trueperaceae bacterium]